MGVVSAGLQFGGLNFASEAWTSTNYAQWLSLVMYIALIVYLAKASMSVKK